MSAGFAVVTLIVAMVAMGLGVVWLFWRSLTPTESQAIAEADRRAAAEREHAFRRGTAAERAAVVRLLVDVRARTTDADQKDGLGRIIDAIKIGGHTHTKSP